MWRVIVFEFLLPFVEISDIIVVIFSLDIQPVQLPKKTVVSAQMAIFITLSSFWKLTFEVALASPIFFGFLVINLIRLDMSFIWAEFQALL